MQENAPANRNRIHVDLKNRNFVDHGKISDHNRESLIMDLFWKTDQNTCGYQTYRFVLVRQLCKGEGRGMEPCLDRPHRGLCPEHFGQDFGLC